MQNSRMSKVTSNIDCQTDAPQRNLRKNEILKHTKHISRLLISRELHRGSTLPFIFNKPYQDTTHKSLCPHALALYLCKNIFLTKSP